MAKGGKNQKANPKSKTSMKKAMKSAAKIMMITLAQMMEVFVRASLEFKDTLMMSLSKKKAYVSDLWTEYGSVSTIVGHILNSTKCERAQKLRNECWDKDRTSFLFCSASLLTLESRSPCLLPVLHLDAKE